MVRWIVNDTPSGGSRCAFCCTTKWAKTNTKKMPDAPWLKRFWSYFGEFVTRRAAHSRHALTREKTHKKNLCSGVNAILKINFTLLYTFFSFSLLPCLTHTASKSGIVLRKLLLYRRMLGLEPSFLFWGYWGVECLFLVLGVGPRAALLPYARSHTAIFSS